MSKNNHKTQVPQQAPAELKPPVLPAAPAPAGGADASRAQIWTFALALALVLVTARVLDHMLPGIPERVIERWLMLGFGVFLAAFLAWLK
jgi:hypothetical protein